MWPFKPRAPRATLEELAAAAPPAPCGQQVTHYEWENIHGVKCPVCYSIRKKQRTLEDENRLAQKIAANVVALTDVPSGDILLSIARNTGLRQAMHGVPPSEARELLTAFCKAVSNHTRRLP